MTKLGEYLTGKSVNRAEIARKAGLSGPRLSELSTNPKARLRANELYLIALALGIDPCELLQFVCGHLTLEE